MFVTTLDPFIHNFHWPVLTLASSKEIHTQISKLSCGHRFKMRETLQNHDFDTEVQLASRVRLEKKPLPLVAIYGTFICWNTFPRIKFLKGARTQRRYTHQFLLNSFFPRRNVNPLRLIVDLKFRYQSDAWLPVDGYSVYTFDFTDPPAKKHLRLLEAGGIKLLTPTSHEFPWNNDIWIGILLHRLEKKASLSSTSKSRMVSLFILWLKDKRFLLKAFCYY